jgi:ABC-type glycerol-3-phosphate transport system substrate-binding protein
MIIFLVLSLTFVLSSCTADPSKNNDNIKTTTGEAAEIPEQTTKEELKDSLPDDLDFNGETLNLYATYGTIVNFYSEAETGDPLYDEVYRRNAYIETRLNMKVNFIEEGFDRDSILKKIRASMAANDRSYDLICGIPWFLPELIPEGFFLDMYKVPHIELSRPWWSQDVTKQLTIAGKLHVAAGEATMSYLGNGVVMFVNNTLVRDYGLPDLYKTVIDGKWTLDYMGEIVRDVYKDINGNGINDKGDLYGGVSPQNWGVVGFMTAADAHMLKISAEGYPELSPDYEKLVVLAEKIYSLFYENQGFMLEPQGGDITAAEEIFRNNRAILLIGKVLGSSFAYRDWEPDFGIIPYPKYDENQKKYNVTINDGALLVIPSNCEKAELAGAFMEAAASYGYNKITPQYFDIALKIKVARDEQTEKMIDIIRSGLCLTLDRVYNSITGGADSVMGDLKNSKSKDFASWYEKNEPKIIKAIDKTVEKIKELN